MAPQGTANEASSATAMNGGKEHGSTDAEPFERGEKAEPVGLKKSEDAATAAASTASNAAASDEIIDAGAPPTAEASAAATAATAPLSDEAGSRGAVALPTARPAAAAGGGFFSRMGSLGSSIGGIGDVYGRAQRRAAELREQAGAEVERLRQQQGAAPKQREVVFIPPPTGTLVVGSPANRDGSPPSPSAPRDGDGAWPTEGGGGDRRALEDTPGGGVSVESQATVPTANRAPTAAAGAGKPNIRSLSISNAFKIVRETGADAAKELIFPIDALAGSGSRDDSEHGVDYISPNSSNEYYSSYSQDDDDDDDNGVDDGSGKSDAGVRNVDKEEGCDDDSKARARKTENEEDGAGEIKPGGDVDNRGDNATAPPPPPVDTVAVTQTPTRFFAATNSVFNAVERYRKLKTSSSFDPQILHQTPRKEEPLVGGADRVGGLRHFQLDGIIDGNNNGGPSQGLPPTLPFRAKRSVVEEVTRDGAARLMDDFPFSRTASRASSLGRGDDAASTAASETTAESVEGLLVPPPPTANLAAGPNTAGPAAGNSKRPSGGKRTSYYEDAVRSVLRPGERAMFFGKGTMGVVLKPTYLASWRGKDGCGLLSPTTAAKKGGVFIDSLVPGGHAEKSGVVFVGDHVVKIGAVNVENMTLEDVVSVILETKRPNIMVLIADHEVEFADRNLDGNNEGASRRAFVSPSDLMFGFANKLAAEGGKDFGLHEKAAQDGRQQGVNVYELKEAESGNSLLDQDDGGEEEVSVGNDREEEVLFKSPGKDFSLADYDDGGGDKLLAEPQSNDLAKPTTLDIDDLLEYSSHRTNAHGKDAETHRKRLALLKRAALWNSDVSAVLRLALSECCRDPRRYSFLEHFFKNNYQSKREAEAKKEHHAKEASVEDNDITSSINQRRLLELYVELCSFHVANVVSSVSDREKLLDRARKISGRFLSEDGASSDQSVDGRLPEYVAHVALGGTERVQAVRFALRDEDEFFEGDDGGDGFRCIRSSLEAFLSTQESFLSFLISDDCARMRAYLRGSSPFLGVEPRVFLKPCANDSTHHNFLLHAILHLVCMKESNMDNKYDEGNFIKNDALLLNSGKRNMGAASLLGCSIFIMRSLQKSMMVAAEGLIEDDMAGTGNNLHVYSALMEDLQFFWEVYIAPAGGSLSSLALSQDAQDSLNDVRRLIVLSVDDVLAKEKVSDSAIPVVAMARVLSSAEVSSSVQGLAEALLREYTLTVFPNFQRHIFHEWATKELERRYDAGGNSSAINEYLIPSEYNGLSKGWMNRFLRQMEFPNGMSLHRPGPSKNDGGSSPALDLLPHLHNGDVALVFGSQAGDGATDQIGRFSCVSVQPRTDGPSEKVLFPDDIPPIFESYATVPPFDERPFQGMLKDEQNSRISIDGWEVSLTNFVIPSQAMGDSVDDNWMYCVSLVLRKSSDIRPQISEREINHECVSELHHADLAREAETFESPLFSTDSGDGRSRKMKVSQELKEFNSKLQEHRWSQQFGQGATIGLALISSRNVTQAMRETLSLLYKDFCLFQSSFEDAKMPPYLCQPLVDILGVLSHSQVEKTSLTCLLQPYLAYTTSRWVHRPLSDQSDNFSEAAGKQLLQALPPVPLALAFVTLLLEQKVVFSSSRRGMLMSASFAMMQLLKPLKWAHLHAPLVPDSMMNELIHYPAPFVLGIPTDEKESAALLSTLPSDVTLVDLDVGRVILASVFANVSKSEEGESDETVAGAMRSQVLFLAESLGGAFGAAMYQSSWCSDSPLQVIPNERDMLAKQNECNFSEVLSICEEFVSELLSGIHPCCLWIEEKHGHETGIRNEPAIIFDEDRFFHIKNLRAEGRFVPLMQKSDLMRSPKFSLSLDHFDLIFETFLRTQCLSTYISDGNKESMLFW